MREIAKKLKISYNAVYYSLHVLVLLLSCAPGPPTPLSILVRASLHCCVKGAVDTLITLSLVFHMSQRFIDTYAMMLAKLSRAPTVLVIKES